MKHVYQFVFGLLIEATLIGAIVLFMYLIGKYGWFRVLFGIFAVITLLWLAYAIGEQWVK